MKQGTQNSSGVLFWSSVTLMAPCLNAEEKLSPFIQQRCIHIWHGISKPCEMLDSLACICSSNISLEPHDSCPSIHNLFFDVHWMKQGI